ncbi:endonuclease domain-containing protein [Micromonospora coerulea]|uniref:endonuclease domain-containing protein n=1 Tax=Micromonospora coerulea TaxID=47856 RepID=UPI00355806F3
MLPPLTGLSRWTTTLPVCGWPTFRRVPVRECVVCGGELTGSQRKYDGEACRKVQGRADWIAKTYGVTLMEWQAIWLHQGEQCAICKRPPRTKADGTEETFHLDHEHAKGQAGPVRGILCPYCNTRLVGRLKSAERAQALADYLHAPPATSALGRVVIAPGRPPKKRRPRRKRAA